MACSPPDFIVMRQPDRLECVVTWESVEWVNKGIEQV